MIKPNYYPRVRLEHHTRRGDTPKGTRVTGAHKPLKYPKGNREYYRKKLAPSPIIKPSRDAPFDSADLPPCRRCLKTISFYRRQTPSAPLNDMCDSSGRRRDWWTPRCNRESAFLVRKCKEVSAGHIKDSRCYFDASYKEVCCGGNDDSVAHSVYPNCFLLCWK